MVSSGQADTAVFGNLYDFYKKNKDWIIKYRKFSTSFNTDMVERKLSFDELNGKLEECAVLILTANSVEQNILTLKLYREHNVGTLSERKLYEIYMDGCVYQFAQIQGINVVHMHPNSTSSFTSEGSANAVRNALERFRPKLVVSLGVAFGINPQKQGLGDVLISSGIRPYDVFNKDVDGKFSVRKEDYYDTHKALNAWNVLVRNENFSLEEKELERCSLIEKGLAFKWQYGEMLSGGSVLSNEGKKQALLRAAEALGEKDIIGGEMEGIGVYSECKKPNIPCVVIKGICDWGAEKNSWDNVIHVINSENSNEKSVNDEFITNDCIKDCVQAYAMDNATEALLRLLRFDSKFLESYYIAQDNSAANKYKHKRKLEKIGQKFELYKRRVLSIIIKFSCLSLIFGLVNTFLSNHNLISGKESLKLIYMIEVVCMVIIVAISEVCTIYPMETHHRWANFSIYITGFSGRNMNILLKDSRPIFNVTNSWWLRNGRVKQTFEAAGNMKGHTSMEVKMPDAFSYKTILQISYEMTNGEQYVHLISGKWYQKFLSWRKRWTVIYCERVYRIEGKKSRIVSIQNAVMGQEEFVEKVKNFENGEDMV